MYLKISADSYTFYDIDPEKGEMPDPGDIEVSDGDYVAFQSLITPDSIVQVIEPERQQPEKGLPGYLEIFDKNQPYLRLFDENAFGFVFPGVFKILPTDYRVDQAEYDQFFKAQNQGEQFRLKAEQPETGGLFDRIETFTPEPIEAPPSEADILKEQLLQQQLATAEAIEKQETDKIEQQLAQAEMFETILQMLEPQGGGE